MLNNLEVYLAKERERALVEYQGREFNGAF